MGIRFTNLSTKPVVHVTSSISNNSIIYDVSTSSFDVTYISNRVKIYYIITLDGFSLSEVEPLDEPIPVTINLYKINNNTQVLVSKVIDEFNYTSELKSIHIDKLFKEAFISSSFDLSFVFEVICDEDIVLSVPSSIIIEGELYNPFKEKAIHETISNDYEVLGKANFDLFTLDLYYNLFNISTSSILPLSIGATYCYGSVGLFGENIRCNYEYRIILEEDYLELIDCINNSTFFHKMTSTEASRYDIIVEDESEIYVNLNNFSYLLKNGSVIDYYLKSNTRYELLVIGTGYHTELNVLVKKIYTDKGLITLNWMGSTLKDIESDLNRIRISYSNYSYITRIDYDKGRYLTFNYITRNNKKYLSSINYCDSFNPTQTEVVLSSINYNYNNYNRLVLLYDSLNNQGLSFDYNNGKLSCVKTVLYNTNEYSSVLSLTSLSNITKVTDEIGKETSYYFDFFGKCYMAIDDKGNMISREYQKNNLFSSTPSLTFNSNGIINTLDVIKNPCFIGNESSSDFEWTISNLSDGVFSKSIGVNGRSALRVINSSSNVITLTQDITNLDIIKGKTIKFSGYIRGNGQVNINLKVNNINNNYIVNARNIWDKIETPFVLILDSVSSVSVEIKISTGSNIRLCEFNVESMQESRLNYLENGDLDNNSLNSIKYWVIEDEEKEYGIINHFNISSPIIDNPLNLLIKKEISLFNCSDKLRRFKQSVDISGGSGEQIIFSFFSRLNITSDEKVIIKINVHYKSRRAKEYPFILSDNTNLHKFNTFSITTESIYDKVEVGIYYQGMETVLFSCFGLFKCDDGTYYYYNEKNSLTEIASGVGLTEIERGENDLVKRYSDKTGSVYEYRYLNNGNIDSISDHDGTNIKYEYDSNSYLSKCVINTKNNKRSILEQINDSNGNPLYIKNFDGSVLAYEYDNRERVEKKNSSSGLVEHFTYDNKDYLINKKYDLNDNLINHDFNYDSSYNLNNISVTNGSNFSKTHNWS